MSLRLPTSDVPVPSTDSESSSNSSATDGDDENWDDWVESDNADQRACQSLFEDKTFPSAKDTLAYDKATHGFDLDETCLRLKLDFHQRIRLINFIRKTMPSAPNVESLTGKEPFFFSDEYLRPVLEYDPLLQTQSDDWSDSDDPSQPREGVDDATRHIQLLEKKLASATQDLAEYRNFVKEQLHASTLIEAINEPSTSTPPPRDDDSQYFRSYNENDIHAIMIQDKVRTATYASFILKSPNLFRDAVVLDVGCGTGILSLFAARGGAKRVIAVDACDITEKAEKIMKDNGVDDVVTVLQGKVEDITLPDGIKEVDIIISEWMGYALLYESMLDSVLVARDRFLRPGGVMAPSQSKMMLALCNAGDIFKERVGFWGDVYGFDLSAMAQDVYDDAIVDVVSPGSLLSAPFTIKDLHLGDINPRQLDFSSSFSLTCTADQRTKVHALLLYFDVIFSVSGQPVPASYEACPISSEDAVLAEVWPVGGKSAPQRRRSQGHGLKEKELERIVSFSTGPKSIPTHWKQTMFLLREPISVAEGTVVSGTFYCRKRETNSRELDVEIHYSVRDPGVSAVAGDTTVQMFKVR